MPTLLRRRSDRPSRRLSPTSALACSALFNPGFEEIEGYVLLGTLDTLPPEGLSFTAELLRAARAKAPSEARMLVDSWNRIEFDHLFEDGSQNRTEWRPLGLAICRAWRAHLHALFPSRRFTLVSGIDDAHPGGHYGVGFRQDEEVPHRP